MPYNNYEGPIYSVLNGKPTCYCCNTGCNLVSTSQCASIGGSCFSTYESCITANSGDAC
jgi:hypothetical protein